MKATICFAFLLALMTTVLGFERPILGAKHPLQGVPFQDALPYIAGGTNATRGEFPYMGALLLKSGANYLFWCGATLYAANKALTAAHCLNSNSQAYAVAFGFTDLMLPPPEDQTVQISNLTDYRIHPDYNENLPEHPNDLAVVILQDPMNELDAAIGRVQLATDGADFVGQDCTVTGWGVNSEGNFPNVLQKADMTVISTDACTPYFPNGTITDKDVCTLTTGKSACTADSGSPMVCQGLLKGIVSLYSGDCTESTPSVFTRITSYLDWIYQQ